MKIGILTRRYGYNMGSTLQAFAMSEVVRKLGHDVEIIDYDESSAHLLWKIRPIVDHLQYKIRPIWRSKRSYLNQRMLQEKKFKKFEEKYLPLSESQISSSHALLKQSKVYDKILVGSDQIWSPLLFDPNYYGSFLPNEERHKIIAYAPSIGISNAQQILAPQNELIRKIDSISCREEAGAKILEGITGRNIPTVLDPTLLVDHDIWESIANDNPVAGLPERYILTYFLGTNTHQNELELLASKHNARIVNISMFNKPNNVRPHRHVSDAGPAEFLYLVKNAIHVATDSFHAAIFSWIFNRDFTVFERFKPTDRQNQNSRIYSLLTTLGKENNLFNSMIKNSKGCFESKYSESIKFLTENL